MAIITISRQYGSGGDEIASRVCETLGYHLFDKRLIAQAAIDVGLSDQEVIDYSEDNHKVRGFLDRLFGRSPVKAQPHLRKEGNSRSEEIRLSEASALALVQKAIRSAYQAGNMVIVGRGGQEILKYYPGVVHIRVEAPLQERIQRMKEQFRSTRKDLHTDIELRRNAESWMLERDAASADYIKRFYNVDWADPLLYHLTLNTGKISIEQAVEIITRLAVEIAPQKSPA